MLHSINSTTSACLNHFVSERDLSLMPFIASLRTSQIMHYQVSSLPKLFWKMVALKVGENWIYYQDLPSWYFSQMWGYMTHQNHFGYFQASLNFTSVGSENLVIIKHQREFWSQKNHGRIKVCCSSWNSDLSWIIPNSDVLLSLLFGGLQLLKCHLLPTINPWAVTHIQLELGGWLICCNPLKEA